MAAEAKAAPPVPLTWSEFTKSIEDLTNFTSTVTNRVAPETLSMCLEYIYLGLESSRRNQTMLGTLQRVPVEMANLRTLLIARPLLYRRALTCTLDFFRTYGHVTEHQSQLDKAIDIIVSFVSSCDEISLLGTYFVSFLTFHVLPEIKIWRDDTSVCCSSTSRMHLVRVIDCINKYTIRGEAFVTILGSGIDIVRPSSEDTEELWLKFGLVEHFVETVASANSISVDTQLSNAAVKILSESKATVDETQVAVISNQARPTESQDPNLPVGEFDVYTRELKAREAELVVAMMQEQTRKKEAQLKVWDSFFPDQYLNSAQLCTIALQCIGKLISCLDAVGPSQVVHHCLDCFVVCLTHSPHLKLNVENFVKIVDQIISLSSSWEINNLALLPCAFFDIAILSIAMHPNSVEEINIMLYEVLPAIIGHCANSMLDKEGLLDRMLLSLLALVTAASERNMDPRAFTVSIIPNLLGAINALRLTTSGLAVPPIVNANITTSQATTLPNADVAATDLERNITQGEWWQRALDTVNFRSSDITSDGMICGSFSEKVLCELLDFALVAIRAPKGILILKDGLKDIIQFCQKFSLSFHMLYDSLVFAKQLLQRNQNVTFVFVGVLPRTFTQLRTMGENSEVLALRIMQFGCLTNQKGLHAVHLFAADILAWITCITKVTSNSEVRSKLLWHVLDVVEGGLKQGHQCDSLISDGIPTLFELESDPVLLAEMIDRLAKQFVTAQLGPLLLQMKQSVIFLSKNQEEHDKVRALFRCLLAKGQRSLVHELNLICQPPFDAFAYDCVRKILYGFSEDKLSSSEFLAICQVTACFLDLGNKNKQLGLKHLANLLFVGFVAGLSELPFAVCKPEKLRKQDRKVESKCVQLCDRYVEHLNRCSLYDAVYASPETKTDDGKDVAARSTLVFSITTETGVLQLLAELFPQDVLADAATMNVLSSIGKRLTSVDSKYSSLRQEVATLTQFFLRDLETSTDDAKIKLEKRYSTLQAKILQSPHNVEMVSKMSACGYSSALWLFQQKADRKTGYDSQLHLSINGESTSQLNLDYRAALRKCLQGWIALLRDLGVTVIQIANELQVCAALFDDSLDQDELRAQRLVVVRMVDQLTSTSRLEKQTPGLTIQSPPINNDEHIPTPPLLRRMSSINLDARRQRRNELLAEEDRLEDEYLAKRQIMGSSDTSKLEIVINSSFFGIAETCGNEIEGCYAPNGSHCEKPLEMGLRVDALVLSLRDASTGIELENCETLMTEQGLYIYKAYHSIHNYDTSHAWEQAIGWLMAQRLVPAIVLPQNFPTIKTFTRIRARLGTCLSSIPLNCKKDLFTDVASYYDLKPTTIRPLLDVYLTPLNQSLFPAAGLPTGSTHLKITKGLTGVILDAVLTDMKGNLNHLLFLSRSLSQLVTVFVQTGQLERAILDVSFDLQRYNLSIKNRNSSLIPLITEPERQTLLSSIYQLVFSHTLQYLKAYSSAAALSTLLKEDRRQFFELKDFIDHRIKDETLIKTERELHQEIIASIKRCLLENVAVVSICNFSQELQYDMLRWMFKNEDRVWRRRGGRPGQETAEGYVGFSRQSARPGCAERIPIPGVVGYVCGKADDKETTLQAAIRAGDVVCYSVGEFILHDQYEIVTAWVDKKFKGLSLAVTMYLQIFDILNNCNCPRVLVDVVQGTIERLLLSSPALDFVARAGLRNRVILNQTPSYQVASDTGTEQFERLNLAVSYLALASSWHNRAIKLNRSVDSASKLLAKFKKVF